MKRQSIQINSVSLADRIYLSIRYSGTEAERQERFETVCKIAACLRMAGYDVYSPISETHPISQYIDEEHIPTDRWLEVDYGHIDDRDVLMVVTDFDYLRSVGVNREIGYATSAGKTIVYVTADMFLPCDRCDGTGWLQLSDGNRQVCPDCCEHDQGWWELTDGYAGYIAGADNRCCKAGCGTMWRDLERL